MPPSTDRSTTAQELATLVGPVEHLPGPRYAGMARRIRELVTAGRLPVGSRLPAERELAAALDVSRVTVASAYRVLREEGFATTRHGSGTVADLRGTGAAWALPRPGADVLDLGHTAPEASPFLLPAYETAMRELPRYLPGHGYAPHGLPQLREAIARWFDRRGLPTDPDQVVVTAGVGDALDLVLDVLLEPGDRVLIEHPTYPGALRLITAAGGRFAPLPVGPADAGALAGAAQVVARQSRPRLAYLMPDAANPTGVSLSAAARRRLAATLWQHGVLSVVDEVTHGLHLGPDVDPPPPYAAGLPDAATVTVGGLAKAVWGGLRIGWLRTDAGLAAQLGEALGRRQLSVALLEQLAATVLVDRLDEVLAHRREQLRERRDALVEELAGRLPDWAVPRSAGGLSLWCGLPEDLSSAAVVAAAAPEGLLLAEGRAFGTGHVFDDHLRLPFTLPVPELRSAAAVLADVVQRLRAGSARRGAVPRVPVV